MPLNGNPLPECDVALFRSLGSQWRPQQLTPMKPSKTSFWSLVSHFLVVLPAQQFMTREGHVHFFSSTPIEDIEADNHQMSGLLDASNGSFAFQVQMRAFHFEKALMEEHFNESYVESDTHPKATFQGTNPRMGFRRQTMASPTTLWPRGV